VSITFWERVALLEGKILRTLDQGKPFVMIRVTDTTATFEVKERNATRTLERSDLEPLYERLLRTGELSVDEIKQVANLSWNSSYAAAVLAQCDGVRATTRPIRLRYRGR